MKIRDFLESDVIEIKRIYQKAFEQDPWFEKLSDDEVGSRWKSQCGNLVSIVWSQKLISR